MPEQSDDTLSERQLFGTAEHPITLIAVVSTMAGGFAGLLAMLPTAVGIPWFLGLFRLRPPTGLSSTFGLPASELVAVSVFALGGIVVLPLFFIATATYLPPYDPAYARGITIGTIFWPGFLIIFWPAGDLAASLAFVVFSLVSHLVYGLVLGLVVHTLTGIPEHEV